MLQLSGFYCIGKHHMSYAQRTWILRKDFSRGQDIDLMHMSILNLALLCLMLTAGHMGGCPNYFS